jgi:hypothetical protein
MPNAETRLRPGLQGLRPAFRPLGGVGSLLGAYQSDIAAVSLIAPRINMIGVAEDAD